MKMQSSLKGKTHMRENCASFSSLALWDTLGHFLWGTRATNTLSLPFASLKKNAQHIIILCSISMYLCAVFMRCVFAGIDWTIVFWSKSVGPIQDEKQKKTLLILHQDPKKQLITFVNVFFLYQKQYLGSLLVEQHRSLMQQDAIYALCHSMCHFGDSDSVDLA